MGFKTVISRADQVLGTPVMEGEQEKPQRRPLADDPTAMLVAAIIAFVSFVIIGLSYLAGDLWFDELLTLEKFITRPFKEVFISYRIPNNHILYTAVLWLWVRFFGGANEAFLRLPCLAMAATTFYLLYAHGRRLFRARSAGFFAMMVMVFSPVYVCFYWQLRGYSLSIMLATLATVGALHIVDGKKRKGLLLFALGAVPLPGVIPSNLMVNAALFIFLLIYFAREKRFVMNLIFMGMVGGLAIVGMVLYGPISTKFLSAMKSTEGWDSGVLAAGHWLLAVFAQVGLFLLACFGLRKQRDLPEETEDDDQRSRKALQRQLPLLAACCLIPSLLLLLIRAPYPRVCLPLLAPLTFAALYFYQPRLAMVNKYFFLLIFFLLANFLVVTRATDTFTKASREAGQLPQNLFQQYYANNRDVSTCATLMARASMIPVNGRVFVDMHYFLALRRYWVSRGGNPRQIECLGWKLVPLQLDKEHYPYIPKFALGYNQEVLEEKLEAELGTDVILMKLPTATNMLLFRVEIPGAEPPGFPFDGKLRTEPINYRRDQ